MRYLLTIVLAFALPVAAYPQTSAPESTEGLEQVIKQMLEAAQQKDRSRLTWFAESLLLPDSADWVLEIFGDETGRQILENQRANRDAIRANLVEAFEKAAEENLSSVKAHRFDGACDEKATEEEYPPLAARRQPVPFYDARIMDGAGNKGRIFWFFVYRDGRFLFLGQVRIKPLFSVKPGEPARIRVGGQVQQARLIQPARPIYPSRAREIGLEGTVKLTALIGRDGEIEELRLMQGHCWFAESAISAVKQWRYRPTLLNGEPVQVITSIDVVFTLRR